MAEFVMLSAAIAVGIIVAAGFMTLVMMNEWVMKKLMAWSYKMTMKLMNEFEENNFMDDEKKIES